MRRGAARAARDAPRRRSPLCFSVAAGFPPLPHPRTGALAFGAAAALARSARPKSKPNSAPPLYGPPIRASLSRPLPPARGSVFWLGMLIVGAIGIKFGKWQRLLYGTDYQGNVCGVDDALGASAKFIVYPRTNEDFILNLQKTNPLDFSFYGICAEKCPGPLEVVCNYKVAGVTGAAQADLLTCMSGSAATAGAADCGAARKNCWVNAQPTAPIMFHCIPQYNVTNAKTTRCTYPETVISADDPSCILATDTQFGSVQRPAKPNLLFDQLNTVQQIWGRWFGDLARAWWAILLVSVGLGLALGFVYVQMLKYLTGECGAEEWTRLRRAHKARNRWACRRREARAWRNSIILGGATLTTSLPIRHATPSLSRP